MLVFLLRIMSTNHSQGFLIKAFAIFYAGTLLFQQKGCTHILQIDLLPLVEPYLR